MEGFQFDDYLEMEMPRARAGRAKPVKRKWREIEAIKDRQRLQKELMDMGFEADLEDIDL
ncbi:MULTISPECIES: DUF3545 family protein [Vibrio]|uniref:DUF3545 domain-containing protein n=1 Tax=Vibrio proteolyticus NBRC 13287 TaxID=1219065 RepID=U3BE30_VIBPR|nr:MULTISPECIES: DUF3545 family protein [Vibrio]NAW57948.1 DUF3545 family protein [Vibrio sp. V36_P2S2PM302]NAX22626.1 DUF3545 family protein [Vibrio sp. V39_P1S14PM300]NAX25256.1 DUF3545 family protein [Vibrio sp. V38_P2S17PM301]NAX31388.1 DUF3545 family protein [Vibrio sp. V37_P2S8PM304]GAD67994.1 hypothetical protein VPR01S_10_01900 [Vibrio proteolyticus NBRC 13287]